MRLLEVHVDEARLVLVLRPELSDAVHAALGALGRGRFGSVESAGSVATVRQLVGRALAPTLGGLSYTQAIDLVAAVTAKAKLVAFDMIEFVPERDLNGTAAITAARIVANVIGCLARVP